MLYLRTGANGSCKSLFTLKDVREKQLKELRPVCVIVGQPAVGTTPANPDRIYVKIYPEVMKEFGWTTCHYSEWWSQPDGTIFLADECHNYFPKRPNGSAVPEYVSRLAEHRSRGFDFFMLTQHPGNIDSFVTKLIGAPGWHQHLKRVAGGSSVTSVLQWDAVNLQCEKNGTGKTAQVTMRGQPKEVYKWYDSAELHTGKLKIPKAAILLVVYLPLALMLLGGAVYFLWKRTGGRASEQAAQAQMVGAPGQAGAPGGPAAVKTSAEYIADYHPRVAGIVHSAPAYDEMTKPKRVPFPAACMQMGERCSCFTQDATPYTTTPEICRQVVKGGIFLAFDPDPAKTAARNVVDKPPQTVQNAPGAPIGLAVIPAPSGPLKDLQGGSVASTAPEPVAQPRVPPSSPWSFRTGG